MNWISALSNPQNKIVRKATAFSGTVLNLFSWPVASVIQRLQFGSPVVLNTGPRLGTTVAALDGVDFQPETITVTGMTNYNAAGVYVLNPSNQPYLRINFGARIGPVDIYVEGYESSSTYKKLSDQTPSPRKAQFNRILTGTDSAITTFVKNCTPVTFKNTSETETGVLNLGGTTHLYLGSDKPFGGFQVNLGSEAYGRTSVYSLEYWNGSWTSLPGTIYSTTSVDDDLTLIFAQSGVIKFTAPSDWVPTVVAGDPQTTANNTMTTARTSNYSYSDNLYFLRIVPPAINAESVPVVSMTLLD
jgi:hypothetical protein